MATPNRAAIYSKIHKVLKKHFKPINPEKLTVLEHLVYACCLENSTYEAADAAFAGLREKFFDWNEVRVSTVAELAEVIKETYRPSEQAANVKRSLQSIFESSYSFDLDGLRKQNIGKSIKDLGRNDGITNFSIGYVTQNGLGGHSIPLGRGELDALVILGAISTAEAEKNQAPALERSIPKNKGVEFGSLLHQLGTRLNNAPFSPATRSLFLEIAPTAKDRLPKRKAKAKSKTAKSKTAKSKTAKSKTAKSKTAKSKITKKKSSTTKKPTTTAKTKKKAIEKKKKSSTKGKGRTTSRSKSTTKKSGSASKRITKRKPR